MKTKILFILLAMLFAVPSFAQKHKGDKDKGAQRQEMLEFKLDFLAKEIDLRDDQKKRFNELYTQMENERRTIRKKIKAAEKSISANKEATDADYEKANREINAAKTEMNNLDRQYDEKFAKFLSSKQMFKLKEAEGKFLKTIQECKDRKSKKK